MDLEELDEVDDDDDDVLGERLERLDLDFFFFLDLRCLLPGDSGDAERVRLEPCLDLERDSDPDLLASLLRLMTDLDGERDRRSTEADLGLVG